MRDTNTTVPQTVEYCLTGEWSDGKPMSMGGFTSLDLALANAKMLMKGTVWQVNRSAKTQNNRFTRTAVHRFSRYGKGR